MMKVCLAIEKFDPKTGGAERYIWDLAHFLAGNGHDVRVICIKSAETANGAVGIEKVPAIRFPQGLRHLSFALMHYLKARRMKGFIHFGVGNTCFMDVYQPHGGIHKAWFLDETLIYSESIRDYARFAKRLSLKDMVQRLLEWITLKITMPVFIAISEKVRRDAVFWFDYPEEKIRLVPNGIDTARFNPSNREYRTETRRSLGIPDDDFAFLFVAQNPRLKGFDILKQACGKMPPSAKFKIIVVGPAGKRLEKGAPENFVFAGRRYDLDRVYPACDCLVHPTYYDACSLVVIEALASGIPIITTLANGASMFVDDGLVIPPADPISLRDAMENMIERPSKDFPAASFSNSRKVFEKIEKIIEETPTR